MVIKGDTRSLDYSSYADQAWRQAITSLERATTRGLFKKYLLLLIYMPLPVLLALLAAARTEMCVDAVGEVADLLEEWSEGEDRD